MHRVARKEYADKVSSYRTTVQKEAKTPYIVTGVTDVGGFVFFLFSAWWARARAHQALKRKKTKQHFGTASQMIVAASCGTKNNNASLQSNN